MGDSRRIRTGKPRLMCMIVVVLVALIAGSPVSAGLTFEVVGGMTSYGSPTAITERDGLCYLGTSRGLSIWTVSDPADIHVLGFLETPRSVVDVMVRSGECAQPPCSRHVRRRLPQLRLQDLGTGRRPRVSERRPDVGNRPVFA